MIHGCEGFRLVYQPQIREGDYALFGAEVLLRYTSPTKGHVFPDVFIPILEQAGLICLVGLWALETALAQCAKWRKKMPEFHISVNLSCEQLSQPDIKESVLDILERSGLPGNALTLEITENIQMKEIEYFNGIFAEWKKAGIEISLDDFGTGYSGLGYLTQFQIDEIKIDRCFISGIQKNNYNYKIVHSIMELAATNNMRVCCEGVEEEEEVQVLAGLKPDLLQGYYFARPCVPEEFEQMYFDS
ncbi:EAL domain-containing protein [Niameybacter massiliensis]|uniref:EAL domain-containing protein n=1 Tax=Holtiella tumoricola TaxID=3018743 RepID=A0AA42DMF6_9FIRM|nr:EAL domain-containing protein [Holtiella tumoricola]